MRRLSPLSSSSFGQRLMIRLGLVNVAAAALTLALGALTGSTDLPSGERMPLLHTFESAAVAAGLAGAGAVLLGRRVGRRFDECRLVQQVAMPDAELARNVLRLPADAARLAGAWWVGVAIGNVVTGWSHHSTPELVAFFLVYLLVGIAGAALTFLFAEREMRIVFAHALRGQEAGGRGIRVRTRLLLGWVVVAAIPLLQIATVALTPGHAERSTLVLLALQGLLAGPLLAVLAGDALESRVERLRDGVARVRRGDLSVRLPVDDPGDLGLLQTGFNDMVTGLQERDRAVTLFSQHVGVGVARRALQHVAGAGADQREASMLFVDVVNSTGITERRPPGEVIEMLDALFDQVERRVAAHGGFINRFMGDGALCLFGAPEADPAHATRALRAAREVAAGADELTSRYPELAVAVGVSSGSVVAGNVGARNRYEYTVIGSAVNEAARLVAAAKQRPGRVLAGERSVLLADPAETAGWIPCGTVQLRGLSAPTAAYAPAVSEGARTAPGRMARPT